MSKNDVIDEMISKCTNIQLIVNEIEEMAESIDIDFNEKYRHVGTTSCDMDEVIDILESERNEN